MQVRPTTLKKIADNLCTMNEHGSITSGSVVITNEGNRLLHMGIIYRDMDGFVALTEVGVSQMNRSTSRTTVTNVLNALVTYGSLRFNNDMTYPVKFRRMSIEQMANEGFVRIEGAEVFITELGKSRSGLDMKKLTFHVPAELVFSVQEAVRRVLDAK